MFDLCNLTHIMRSATGKRCTRLECLTNPATPPGIDRSVFEEVMAGITADRPAAMKTLRTGLAEQLLRSYRRSARGCARLHPGLHGGLPRRPGQNRTVLVLQGDQDRILPPEATGNRLPPLPRNSFYIRIAGARTRSPGPTPTRSTRPSWSSSVRAAQPGVTTSASG